jgi:hypothetical protein
MNYKKKEFEDFMTTKSYNISRATSRRRFGTGDKLSSMGNQVLSHKDYQNY